MNAHNIIAAAQHIVSSISILLNKNRQKSDLEPASLRQGLGSQHSPFYTAAYPAFSE
jgi:hypothetical protein